MPLSYKKIQSILKDYNFVLSRSKGSHFRYEKNGYGLTVAFHKEYPPKTAKSMLSDISEITGESYQSLIKKYKIKCNNLPGCVEFLGYKIYLGLGYYTQTLFSSKSFSNFWKGVRYLIPQCFRLVL